MDTSEAAGPISQGVIEHATTMVRAAADARKCWTCGCLRHALDTIDRALPSPKHTGALDAALAEARDHLLPERYECRGCDVCFPAVVLNDLAADHELDEAIACSLLASIIRVQNSRSPWRDDDVRRRVALREAVRTLADP
jgi:tetrahydromethanopterin S-methyltransferase subunit A